MPAQELSASQIAQLVGTNHPTTGTTYPPPGTLPWYNWLMRTVHRLSSASAGALAVYPDADAASSVFVAPGRCSIDGVALDYPGGTLDLTTFNNATALVYLEDLGGTPAVAAATTLDGWPATAHLKLAEASLATGAVVSIVDRRFETFLKA